jgi:hypothetical protein
VLNNKKQRLENKRLQYVVMRKVTAGRCLTGVQCTYVLRGFTGSGATHRKTGALFQLQWCHPYEDRRFVSVAVVPPIGRQALCLWTVTRVSSTSRDSNERFKVLITNIFGPNALFSCLLNLKTLYCNGCFVSQCTVKLVCNRTPKVTEPFPL